MEVIECKRGLTGRTEGGRNCVLVCVWWDGGGACGNASPDKQPREWLMEQPAFVE